VTIIGEVHFQDVLRTIVRRWIIFSLTCLLAVALAVFVAFTSTPKYRAQLVLSQVSEQGTTGISSLAQQVSALAGINLGMQVSGGDKQAWLAMLSSNAMVRKFIEEQSSLQEIFWERWDSTQGTWRSSLLGDTAPPSVAEAVRYIKGRVLKVDPDTRTGLVTVSVDWKDPATAARWANAFVEMTNEVIRTTVIDESRRSIEFLEAELEKTNVLERRQIIYRLIESRTSEIMMANSRPQYAFWIVDPATPPDQNHYIWPKRALIILVGLIGGAALGALACLILGIIPESRPKP
jgi:uncharacterized protein involved in exopolysaccharide biosynthesis